MEFASTRGSQRYPLFGTGRILTSGNREILAQIANISFSGIGLYAAESLREFSLITLIINFTDISGSKQECSIEGIVYWTTQRGKIYEMGIRFSKELTPESHPVLFKHIQDIAEIGSLNR